MKKHIFYRGAMTLLCSTILAACGSSSSGSISSKATDTNNTASTAELKAAQDVAAQAKAEVSSAQNKLNEAQSKLNQAQTDLATAQANSKTTADELNKLKAELEKAKADAAEAAKDAESTQAAAVAAAKTQAVEDYKKELAEQADKEANRQKNIKTELDKLFVLDNRNELPTKQDDDEYQRNRINTNILSIDHAKGKVTSTINPSAVPELYAIKINDTSIPLLKKEFEEDERQNLAFKKFDEQDIPKNAKGWVGSMGIADADKGMPVFNKMRFGVYVDENNVSHLFVHGRTPGAYSISQKNETYAYQGHAIIGKNGEYTPLENAISGEVDFKNKQVNLNLQADKETSYKLNGKINGNAFASEEGADVYTKGGFYGSINNIGGMLQINKGKYAGYDGVYGAGQVKEISK